MTDYSTFGQTGLTSIGNVSSETYGSSPYSSRNYQKVNISLLQRF